MRTSICKRKLSIAGWTLILLLTISAISADRLQIHVRWLADAERDGRRSGTPAATSAAEYIRAQFTALDMTPQFQEFGASKRNVVAKLGTAEKYVLIGSHYDGQGSGMPSASDNAAGIAVMLEIARELKTKSLPASFVFVAFDDEEQGLNGSRYYVDHPPYPLDNALAAIILDTMGRPFMDLSSWTLFVLGTEYSRELAQVVQRRSRPDMLVAGTDLIGPRSDFAPFALKRVPYLFLTHATHKDYHGPGDRPERIDYQRLMQDTERMLQLIQDIAQLKGRPGFLDDPVYPPDERTALIRQIDLIQRERKDLPRAYALIFPDLKDRLQTDDSREIRRVATSAFLALATPRLSGFMLNFILAPYYESAGEAEILAAIQEEAAKWQE